MHLNFRTNRTIAAADDEKRNSHDLDSAVASSQPKSGSADPSWNTDEEHLVQSESNASRAKPS